VRVFFFFSSRRRHTRFSRDWSSDVCSSDLMAVLGGSASDRAEADGAPRGHRCIQRLEAPTRYGVKRGPIEYTPRLGVDNPGAAEIGRASWRERGESAAGRGALETKRRAQDT